MRKSLRIDFDVVMEMRDGVKLRANIYRPNDNGSYPTILIRTAYNKQSINIEGFLNIIEAAHDGYAIVIQDIRGRFASEGKWDRLNMFEIENLDGYDSVEWIARQSWCDGNVGMAGGSYLAAMAWIAAMENPPHLKAISPWIGDMGLNMCPSPETGKINFYAAVDALAFTAVDLLNKQKNEGKEVNEIYEFIQEVLENPDKALHYLPLKDIPFRKFDLLREMWENRLTPLSYEEYKKHRKYEKIKIPVLQIGGWFDQLLWATFENFYSMKKYGGSEFARNNQYIMIGPWMHGPPQNFIGEMGFGRNARVSGIDIHRLTIQFFDKYLKGENIDIPYVRYFVLGKNCWKESESWPPESAEKVKIYLHSNGKANTLTGDGFLNSDVPGNEPPDKFVYTPLNPVPTVGGKIVPTRNLVPGPFDQTAIELREDVLCYTTEILKEDLEVAGPVKLHLYASTTVEDTDFTAKLIDVHPNGRAYNIADGIQRVSYRDWKNKEEPVIPSKVYKYIIDLGHISILFFKGHRIRVEISSSNFPLYDRNMNTGNKISEDTAGKQALQTIYHDKNYPSYLELPISSKRVRIQTL